MVWNRLTVQIIQSCVQSVISSFGESLHADRDYVKEGIPILTRGSPSSRDPQYFMTPVHHLFLRHCILSATYLSYYDAVIFADEVLLFKSSQI